VNAVEIRLGDDSCIKATGVGSIRIELAVACGAAVIDNVYYSPDMGRARLLSVGKLISTGYKVNFSKKGCTIRHGGRNAASGTMTSRIYTLDIGHSHIPQAQSQLENSQRVSVNSPVLARIDNDINTWHIRYGLRYLKESTRYDQSSYHRNPYLLR
jgi:hypothetical protein